MRQVHEIHGSVGIFFLALRRVLAGPRTIALTGMSKRCSIEENVCGEETVSVPDAVGSTKMPLSSTAASTSSPQNCYQMFQVSDSEHKLRCLNRTAPRNQTSVLLLESRVLERLLCLLYCQWQQMASRGAMLERLISPLLLLSLHHDGTATLLFLYTLLVPSP